MPAARKRKSSGVGAKLLVTDSAASPSAAGPGEGSLAGLDGRTARIASSVREAFAEVRLVLQSIVFAERPAADLRLGKEPLAEVHVRCCARGKTLAGCEAKLRALLGRISHRDLVAERESVQTLLHTVQCQTRFNALCRQASPPQSDWQDAVSALRELKIPLGLSYALLGLRVGINRSIMFGEPDVCVQAFKQGSPEARHAASRTYVTAWACVGWLGHCREALCVRVPQGEASLRELAEALVGLRDRAA